MRWSERVLKKRKAEVEALQYGTFEQKKEYIKIKTRNINIQIERAEQKGLTGTKAYEELTRTIGGKRAKTGRITKSNVESKITKINMTEKYDINYYLRNITKNFSKFKGINEKIISDFLESQKSDAYGQLKEYFSSDEIVEIMIEGRNKKSLGYLTDRINAKYTGEMIDPEEWREMLITGKFLDGTKI